MAQIVYQFTSSAANNGSGFEGMADNTMFWNTATGIVMFYGRYLSIASYTMALMYNTWRIIL